MKKNFTSKLDRAIASGYNDLFRQMEFIQFSAKRISEKDFDTEREYEDLLEGIVEEFQKYKNLKKYIELLEDMEEEDI